MVTRVWWDFRFDWMDMDVDELSTISLVVKFFNFSVFCA